MPAMRVGAGVVGVIVLLHRNELSAVTRRGPASVRRSLGLGAAAYVAIAVVIALVIGILIGFPSVLLGKRQSISRVDVPDDWT